MVIETKMRGCVVTQIYLSVYQCQLSKRTMCFSSECQGSADIVFAIDVSGSIRPERFYQVLEFVVGAVENLEVFNDKVRVGALSFSDNAYPQFHLNQLSARQDVIQVGDVIISIHHVGQHLGPLSHVGYISTDCTV